MSIWHWHAKRGWLPNGDLWEYSFPCSFSHQPEVISLSIEQLKDSRPHHPLVKP